MLHYSQFFILFFIIFSKSGFCEKLTCNGKGELCFQLLYESYDFFYNLFGGKLEVSFSVCTAALNSCVPVIGTDPSQINEFLEKIKFQPSLKTIVIVHGFSNENQWTIDMARMWLRVERVNVIIVHWPNTYSRDYRYRKASLSTEKVAQDLTEFIKKVCRNNVTQCGLNLHIVGHSLGSHIAGQTGRLLRDAGLEVQRITALDPAHPCFEDESASLRLRKDDAKFIDVIHTNADSNNENLGSHDLIGHMDFYPNGGNDQPHCRVNDDFIRQLRNFFGSSTDCNNKVLTCFFQYTIDIGNSLIRLFLTIMSQVKNLGYSILFSTFSRLVKPVTGIGITDILKKAADKNISCDHGASIQYFMESLNPYIPNRWANPVELPVTVTPQLRCQNLRCDNKTCVEMGIRAELYSRINTKRAFYVDTSKDFLDCNNI